ncbi:MAG: A/G-specific adenine glycosylase [Micavibrio sp.]
MSGSIIPDKLSNVTINSFRNNVLGWYDKNRRTLPWRALPGQTPDPYHVWLSEVMLQQTVVAAVIPYFLKFTSLWPTIHDLACAPSDDVMKEWAGLGYYARARNLHKGAKFISTEQGGLFPQDEKALKTIPGVGDYTAAAILSIAFDKPSVVVDGNVERVMARYFAIQEPLPMAKASIKKVAALLADGRPDRPSDYAQALMDIGATVCIPKAPRCGLCPLSRSCRGKRAGIAANLPTKAVKKNKKIRYGHIYWVENKKEGLVLLERRPDKGLLGGMMAFPTTEWGERNIITHNPDVLEIGKPQIMKGYVIKHSFTHFDLELQGFSVKASKRISLTKKAPYSWVSTSNIKKSGLPSVFQKFAVIVSENK